MCWSNPQFIAPDCKYYAEMMEAKNHSIKYKKTELHPRFHVKSLAWRAIMGDAVLEDFRGKDCAFVANWLRGKGLNKLCAVFEVFKF